MSDTTKIQWANATFNPWIGCTKVSAGCANCYAENTTRARVLRSQGHETWGKGAKRSRTSAALWRKPYQWNRIPWVCPNGLVPMKGAPDGHGPYTGQFNKMPEPCCECGAMLQPMKVFPSLCDWLDFEIPIQWLADFLRVVRETPNLTWILLTKRPENFNMQLNAAMECADADTAWWLQQWDEGKPPQNVWMVVSVENQLVADKRIPELLKIPAVCRGLSVEPMLGPVEFSDVTRRTDAVSQLGKKALAGISWVIFGGESGTNARPCNVDWIRDGVNQCQVAGVAAFVKQIGRNPQWSDKDMDERWYEKLSDKKGGNMDEWPHDIRVRQMPKL